MTVLESELLTLLGRFFRETEHKPAVTYAQLRLLRDEIQTLCLLDGMESRKTVKEIE